MVRLPRHRYNDPAEDMTAIVIMQRAHMGDQTLPMWNDFWTTIYQAIDDRAAARSVAFSTSNALTVMPVTRTPHGRASDTAVSRDRVRRPARAHPHAGRGCP
ncbi:hypothetical protein [Micromonospora sp. NPDC023633]|uniref:hypothetical protein n=1 Tax=Micromonospora sp. NPDC023633 TaxID=3154320 RepID=UPI0033F308CA